MASNRSAPEALFTSSQREGGAFGQDSTRADEGPLEEWNPTEESVRPVRGRHRVGKQRNGGLARSSTVLGVGVIAAVAGGGMASAQTGKPPVSISVPDLPSVGSLISDGETPQGSATPLSNVGAVADEVEQGSASDAGETLRSRIMTQVEQQQSQAEEKAAAEAAAKAEKEAKEQAAAAQKEAEEKAAAEKRKAEEEARKKAEAERLAALAKQYTLPTSSYTVSSTFGQAGAYWSSGQHTGLDLAAPTGTLLKAVHTGTITSAGWDGSYGYKTVLTLDDGTEIWYAHQSSVNVSVGQQVNTGEVIGRVGATGNVTGAHLHMEVRPAGSGSGIDPMAWMQSKGLTV